MKRNSGHLKKLEFINEENDQPILCPRCKSSNLILVEGWGDLEKDVMVYKCIDCEKNFQVETKYE